MQTNEHNQTSVSSDSPERQPSKPERKPLPSTPSPPAQDGDLTAWLQVLGCFLININNWGLANSFGAFQAFYETDLLKNHTPSSISWIGTLQTSLILIIGVFSGPLFDMGYFYPILLSASILLVFSLMMLSLASQYYQVMLTWGVLLGICSGLLYIPSVAMIPLYFQKRRAFALGCATAGGSVGGIIFPLIVRRLLVTVGFGWACRVLGFIALVTLTVATLLIKPGAVAQKKPIRQLFDNSVIKDIPFTVLIVAAFFNYLGLLVPYILTPTYALVGLGSSVSTNLAYYLLALPNVGQFFGRIVPGLLVDMKIIGPEITMFTAVVVCGLLILCWIAVSNLGGFVVLILFYGFFAGIMTTIPAVIIPYLCPSLQVIGTRMGMVYGSSGVGALIGTPVALAITQASHDAGRRTFLGAQLWAGLTSLVTAALVVYPSLVARRNRHAAQQRAAAAAAAQTE